jgi:hypothetical protein
MPSMLTFIDPLTFQFIILTDKTFFLVVIPLYIVVLVHYSFHSLLIPMFTFLMNAKTFIFALLTYPCNI